MTGLVSVTIPVERGSEQITSCPHSRKPRGHLKCLSNQQPELLTKRVTNTTHQSSSVAASLQPLEPSDAQQTSVGNAAGTV